MNISIQPELEKFVEQEVKSGLHQSVSEGVRAGLRRLKENTEGKARFIVSFQDKLEEKLLQGVEQLDRGNEIPADQVLCRTQSPPRPASPSWLKFHLRPTPRRLLRRWHGLSAWDAPGRSVDILDCNLYAHGKWAASPTM